MKRLHPALLAFALCSIVFPGQSALSWPNTSQAAAAPAVEVVTETAEPRLVVQPTYKVGEKIVIAFEGDTIENAETSLRWTLPPTVQTEAGSNDGRRLLAWAPPGSYDVKLRAEYTLDVLVPDPEDPAKTKIRRVTFPAYEYSAKFTVVGLEPPKPEPQPEPPKPEPEPPKPLTGLAALLPDTAKRHVVSEFFSDLAAEAAAGSFTSTSHFRNAYRKAIADSQASGLLPKGIAALDAPISTRIGVAIGMADVSMDATKTSALAAELGAIAKELAQ